MKKTDIKSLTSKIRDVFSSISLPWNKISCTPTVFSTGKDYNDFVNEHPVIKEFHTKVVGVSFPNDDGSSRQAILSNCRRGDYITLEFYRYHGRPAYAVFTEHGQIGNLSADLAESLTTEYGSDFFVSGFICQITGGSGGLYYGCNIFVRIYQS